ncbi:MAG: bifunctional adenosylcobinamide kinase/adenosylcobinamide-phosphate guanylyltransferase [Candidatus Omnitrophota bacterium]
MNKLILVTGGARSGKSTYAVKLAKNFKKVAFIATCASPDREMRIRIKAHRLSRPKDWKVYEEEVSLAALIKKIGSKYDVILVDCLGLWVSNLLSVNTSDRRIKAEVLKMAESAFKAKAVTVIVSNEVGQGIVPDNPLARKFRDVLGAANQLLAHRADKVVSMHVGIPVTIKGG